MNIDALKAVRENFKMGYALSFAEAMLIQQAIDTALQSGNSGQPAGYVLVPVEPTQEMLTASYLFTHVDNTVDSWKAMLAAAPKAPASQLTPAPGWTGNDDANAALVMLDRIDTLDTADDDRIEEIKQIIRSLAAPKVTP